MSGIRIYPRNNGIAVDGNQIIYSAGFILAGQKLTLNPFWVWKTRNNNYSNLILREITIPFSSAGKERIDRIAATVNNDFVRIAGTETEGVAVAPELPPDMVEVTFFTVTDGSISQPPLPIIGSDYVRKSFFADNIIDTDVSDVSLPNTGRYNSIVKKIGNNVLQGMYKFHLDSEVGALLSVGQMISIDIDSGFATTLKNNYPNGLIYPFINFPNNTDFLAANKSRVVCRFTGTALAFQSYSLTGSETLAAAKLYADIVSRSTPQFNITGNTVLTNAHNGSILKIKANATITIPTGLVDSFSFTARTFLGATATWAEGVGFAFDAPEGKIQDPFRLVTFFKDGNSNTGILEGGLRL